MLASALRSLLVATTFGVLLLGFAVLVEGAPGAAFTGMHASPVAGFVLTIAGLALLGRVVGRHGL